MKKGSALLIVLGMVAFMAVSAVGFSIYMRTSRAPSGYLRRNVAARYLVKAALAKAIGELDGDCNTNPNWGPTRLYGIHDDPFPGIVLDATERSSSNGSQNGDYWFGRVFMPFGASNPSATVPTLTLESLAYLPPALIDDVRQLSRYTRTATWRQFPYGAGRYAYCAVNVSDLFDINKLRAGEPRDSGMNRITLATLCMDASGNVNTAEAGNLDAILDRFENVGVLANPVPFVSLADFNLVAGAGSPWAPFISAIGQNSGAMLTPGDWRQGNALFITDTWFPSTNTTANAASTFDLASNAQPFSGYTATGFLQTQTLLNPTTSTLYENNLGIGVACLYDYLDSDSKPISLALPTVESVPMVVGVSCPDGLRPQLDEIATLPETTLDNLTGTGTDVDGNSQPATIVAKRAIKSYGVTSFGNRVNVQVVATSPFKRLAATQRAKTYSVRGLLRVWLAQDGMGCRPPEDVNLHPKKDLWEDGALTSGGLANNGVATFISNEMTLSEFAGDVKTTSDAVADKLLTFSNLDVKMPIWYEITETIDQAATASRNPNLSGFSADSSNFKDSYKSLGDLKDNVTALRSLKGDGSVDSEDGSWQKAANGAQFNTAKPYGDPDAPTEFDPSSLSRTLRLYAALWIQVRDGNQVVDMVPACATDDNEWLSAGLPGNNAVYRMLGDGAPLLNFKGDADITYATIAATLSQPVSYDGWKALYAVDPRYNFAPEDWFSSMSQNASKSEWMTFLGLDGNSSTVLGQNGRDHDIFMFVSDQEYLQSIGELQFLPRLDVMDGSGRFMGGDYAPDFHGNPFSNRTGPTGGSFANGGLFWKTYTAFDNGDGTQDINPYRMVLNGQAVEVTSDASGFKINPFSQDDRILGAAIRGTPFDWYVASTNSNQTQSGGRRNNLVGDNMTLDNMMQRYSFGKPDVAKMSEDDMIDVIEAFKDSFRARAESGSSDWLMEYGNLGWAGSGINDENKTFLGAALDEALHGVDRKYLYSFWRECFGNRQQLFLIFVRAEPTSVGGGGASGLASQLGGKAVALVWRDPEPLPGSGTRPSRSQLGNISTFLTERGGNNCPPHRTRVLFYHQFE